jgi:hypothetical protein
MNTRRAEGRGPRAEADQLELAVIEAYRVLASAQDALAMTYTPEQSGRQFHTHLADELMAMVELMEAAR